MIIEEDEAIKQFFPNGFGKKTKETDVARQLEKSKRPTVSGSTIKGTVHEEHTASLENSFYHDSVSALYPSMTQSRSSNTSQPTSPQNL